MPPVSIAQSRAMHAAASGRSTLGIPVSVGKEFIGDGPPQKRLPAKKPTHRGRKPSTKPGAGHLAKLQQAHGAGDFKAAKTHALNYAKAVHSGMSSDVEPDPTDPNEAMENESAPVAAVAASPMPTKAPQPSNPSGSARATLAKLALRPRPTK